MTGTGQNRNEQDSKPAAGDALFIGGMMTVFSILFPGFGVIGLAIGGMLILSGCYLSWHVRRRGQVSVRVSTRVDT